MMINKSIILLVLVILLVLSIPQAFAQTVGTWRGYAYMDGYVAANGTYITAHVDNSSSAAATTRIRGGEYALDVPQGYYSLDVDCTTKVNFKVCGIAVAIPSESCTAGPHYNGTTPNFNLTVSKLTSGSCTYSCGCSGGYCCSGATEYTDGSGTGTCQSSACTAATTTTAPGGGGGGGGGGAATTVTVATTTTTTPPIKETETVASIPAGSTGNFSFETVPITEIKVDVKNAVTNAQITVTKTDAAPATVAIAAPGVTYAYFNIEKINVADANVNKVTIKFKVEKTWITTNNIDTGTITLNRYMSGAWVALTTKLVSSNGYYYFEAESPGLSVFVVTAQKKPVTTTIPVTTTAPVTTTTVPIIPPVLPPTTLYIIAGIILIIIVVIIFVRISRKKGKTSTPL
jgi:PGF-pre-PGF domain-containing protein